MQPKFSILTRHPVAVSSLDHLHPHGTMRDNNRDRIFNNKLYKLFPDRKPMHVLDVGCSGGGFVKDCLDDGHIGIGLEGSDYSKARGRAEWATIPQYLFTCDVTKYFCIVTIDPQPMRFDAVTAWEFLEHIEEVDLGIVFKNIRNHMRDKSLFIGSIGTGEYKFDGVDLHRTVRPPAWWNDLLLKSGFIARPDLYNHFGPNWVRGPHRGDNPSFNFAVQYAENAG